MVLRLLLSTHPLPAAAVALLVAGLTAALGAATDDILWATASTAAGQASVGWSNDAIDARRDIEADRREKPVVRGLVSRGTLWIGAVVAAPLAVALAVPLGGPETGVMAAAVASAWLYNAGLKATPVSWLPYAMSFGLLPVFAWSVAGRTAPWWVVAGAALLGVAAHLMNVLPDLSRDVGLAGLPHRLGPRRSLMLAAALLAVALGGAYALGAGWRRPTATVAAVVGAALVAGAVAAARRGRTRLAFQVTVAAAAAV